MVERWTAAHPRRSAREGVPKIQYAVQAGIEPPTIVLFISGGELGDDYLRFIENRLREEVEFTGTPIRVVTRSKQRREALTSERLTRPDEWDRLMSDSPFLPEEDSQPRSRVRGAFGSSSFLAAIYLLYRLGQGVGWRLAADLRASPYSRGFREPVGFPCSCGVFSERPGQAVQ